MFAQIILPALFVMFGMWVGTAFPPPGDDKRLMLSGSDSIGQNCAVEGSSKIKVTLPFADLQNTPSSASLANAMVDTAEYFGEKSLNLVNNSAFQYVIAECTEFSNCSYQDTVAKYLLDTTLELQHTRRTALSLENSHDTTVSLSIGVTDKFAPTARTW